MKLILFGAGNVGREVRHFFGDFIECFVDNDTEKQGKEVEGCPVISYEELKKKVYNNPKAFFIMITVQNNRQEIERQLISDNLTFVVWKPDTRPIKELKRLFFKIGQEKKISGVGDCRYIEMILGLLGMEDIEVVPEDAMPGMKYAVICKKDYFEQLPELQNKYKNGVIPVLGQAEFCDSKFFVVERHAPWNESEIREIIRNSPEIERQDAYVANAIKYPVGKPVNINIETVNLCNGHCTFCPASVENNKRIPEYMEDTLFEKIINELHSMQYDGELALYANNEPLIDKRIIEFVRLAKEKVTGAEIRLLTNGRLLSLEKFIELWKWLDVLCIENYSNDGTLLPNVKKIIEFCEANLQYKEKVTIIMRNEDEVLSSRGSLNTRRTEVDDYGNHSCTQPFLSMYIHPNGDCSICCADVYGDVILGNAAQKTLEEIWHSEKYEKVRKRISKGRKSLERCKGCDQFIAYK